jgi:uncharacterized damage-inducible protein DinB
MHPDQAAAIRDFLLANLELEVPTTASVMAAVPADRSDYKPDPLSKSALGLVQHLTVEDEWFLGMVADGRFAMPPDSDATGPASPAEAAARYTTRMPQLIDRVRSLSGQHMAQEMDLFGGMMRLPVVGVLSMMIRHSTHHRGQLSSYLRAMGSKVPSIYGPSADTQQAAAV